MAISNIVVVSDTATPALGKLLEVMDPKAIAANIGEAEVILFQNHFSQAPANKMGWHSTGFWPAAARATNYSVVPQGVTINVNKQGVRQRYAGGEIHPTGGHKYLTIPARSEAYGKRASEFTNLKVAFGRNGPFALVEVDQTNLTFGRKRKDGTRSRTANTVGGGVMFWLVKSVYQAPDASVLPSDSSVLQTAVTTTTDLLEQAAQ